MAITEQDLRLDMLNTLLTTPHRELAKVWPIHDDMAAKDPKVVDLVKQRGLKPFAEFGKTLTATIRTHADENRQLIRETAADGGR